MTVTLFADAGRHPVLDGIVEAVRRVLIGGRAGVPLGTLVTGVDFIRRKADERHRHFAVRGAQGAVQGLAATAARRRRIEFGPWPILLRSAPLRHCTVAAFTAACHSATSLTDSVRFVEVCFAWMITCTYAAGSAANRNDTRKSTYAVPGQVMKTPSSSLCEWYSFSPSTVASTSMTRSGMSIRFLMNLVCSKNTRARAGATTTRALVASWPSEPGRSDDSATSWELKKFMRTVNKRPHSCSK